MGRTFYMTESQMKACIKHQLKEMDLNGDEALSSNNGNMQQAAHDVMNTAKKSGVNPDTAGANVTFSNDALKKNGINEGIRICKRDVRKAMASKLVSECRSFKKGDIKKARR